MTAELIVMNKNGIALAADSAVTVSTAGGPAKVYNTSNKLFSLSKVYPVGVMIYGGAQIMGLPWEVVIKRYREYLGDQSFATLDEYVEDFFNHLKSNALTRECYDAYIRETTSDVFFRIANDVDSQVEAVIEEEDGVDASRIEEIHKDVVRKFLARVKEGQKELGVKLKDIKTSMENHRALVRSVLNGLVQNRPIKGSCKKQLTDACLIMAIVFPSMRKSGLVIAGYGQSEIFPHARAFEIHKVLDENIHFTKIYEADVSVDSDVHIRAFAQTNETKNFMNGVSSRVAEYLGSDVKRILTDGYADSVTDLLVDDGVVNAKKKEECRKYLKAAGRGAHDVIKGELENISQKEFSAPVVNAVTFFSPTEMATMAKTLVSLESFRQQVTLSSETVGGPIDVAVITRGDGFIWIDRKHYFSPELNHHFFANYFRRSHGERKENEING